ncbi:MAG TPA: DUF1579 domain-containing protein [Vicinamibacterales bacterium]|nr:DUF1579 domain-containing protein [Vicinamibacterales bacterium]
MVPRSSRPAGAVAFFIALLSAVPAAAQSQPPGAPPGLPPLPKPGPEHELFRQEEGTWDAVVEMSMPPGQAVTSRGVETNTIGCGGLCLISDFKGELMPGAAFHGHGITTWDPAKKKYVGSWTDSMSQGLGITEGTWDAATRTLTGWMEGPDMTGQTVRVKSVVEYRGETRIFTLYGPGPAGPETPMMKITYTRRR